MKMFPFLKWYLLNEYWPDKSEGRLSLLLNKFWYLLLLLIGFLALGLSNGFQATIERELNDPYANSIPTSARLVNDFDPAIIKEKFPELQLDPILILGHSRVVKKYGVQERDTIYLNGISIAKEHPYMAVIERESFEGWGNGLEQGLFLSEKALGRLGVSPEGLTNMEGQLMIDFVDLGLDRLNLPLSVSRVCKTLPSGLDMVIDMDYHRKLLEESTSIERVSQFDQKSVFEIKVSDSVFEYDSLFFWSSRINEFMSQNDFEDAIATPKFSETAPGLVVLNTGELLNKAQADSLLNQLNGFINTNLRAQRSVMEFYFKTTRKKVIGLTFNDLWRDFTITGHNADRSRIFEIKSALEQIYPDLKTQMRGFNMIQLFGRLSDNMGLFRKLGVAVLVVLSIIVNYQVLNHHIYKRRQNISYLQTVGVDNDIFRRIYLGEAIVETIIFALISFLIADFFGPLISKESFYLSNDIWIQTFLAIMLISDILVYLFAINKYLKKSFREIIEG